MTEPELSVLIPFYNEAGNIIPLLEEVHEALDGIAFEVVCVNDCSGDTTEQELAEAAEKWPETVSVFTHVERAGKSAALFTGLKAVRGVWTQLIDGDGQNDINDTARLWKSHIAGQQTGKLGIIAGKRNSRNDSGFKWLQSRIANGVRRF
ncbi:MAG: glycosyltransferase, partial [Alphaproteobacteria bacterium]|nr:glycosyltransferase [Alphaproteobacteria bacterium]